MNRATGKRTVSLSRPWPMGRSSTIFLTIPIPGATSGSVLGTASRRSYRRLT